MWNVDISHVIIQQTVLAYISTYAHYILAVIVFLISFYHRVFWRIFAKAWYSWWYVFVPWYNIYILFSLAHWHKRRFIACIMAYIVWIAVLISTATHQNLSWLMPIVYISNVVILFTLTILPFDIAKVFGKSRRYWLWLCLLPMFFFPHLARSNAIYSSPSSRSLQKK